MSLFKKKKEPKQERSKETVNTILQSVVALITEGKANELTASGIAVRAGVSPGSLYQYFPGKEAIFTYLTEWYFKGELEIVRTSLLAIGEKTPAEAISQIVDKLFEVRKKNLKLERAMMEFFSRTGDLHFLMQHDAALIAEIEKAFDRYQLDRKQSQIRRSPKTAFILAHTLRALFIAASLEYPEFYQSTDFADEIKTLLVRYLEIR